MLISEILLYFIQLYKHAQKKIFVDKRKDIKKAFYKIVARRAYTNNGGYESTYKNLLINADTKVICQGFTGKQVSTIQK